MIKLQSNFDIVDSRVAIQCKAVPTRIPKPSGEYEYFSWIILKSRNFADSVATKNQLFSQSKCRFFPHFSDRSLGFLHNKLCILQTIVLLPSSCYVIDALVLKPKWFFTSMNSEHHCDNSWKNKDSSSLKNDVLAGIINYNPGSCDSRKRNFFIHCGLFVNIWF